jgi:exopolyphosphatase/pppGpp-phosphohydrolase
MEPRAPTPSRRIEALRQLSTAGVPTAVMVAPIVPAINDAEIERILDAAAAVGVAGTLHRLAALDRGGGPTDGHVLSAHALDELTARLARMTVAERRALPTMEPERAPVIPAGALILRQIVRRYRLDGLEASERDLLDGAALLATQLRARDEGAAPPGAFTCC